MSKRRCPTCNTPLTDYNPGPYCYAHTEGMLIKEKSPITVCTSPDRLMLDRKGLHSVMHKEVANELIDPFDDGEIIGVVTDNKGTIKRFNYK